MKDTMIIQCPCGGTLEITFDIKHNESKHKQQTIYDWRVATKSRLKE